MIAERHRIVEDFHVHSTFSDDAISSLSENIAAASARGIRVIRLTEHVRASTTWVAEFVAAVAAEPTPEGLTVLTGVEAKILDANGTLDVPADLTGIDAIVMADHQFPGPDGPWTPAETRARIADGLAAGDAIEGLVGAMIGAMTRAPGNQLAHCFSILPKIGLSEDDLSDEQLDRWATAAAASDTLVEVNEKWGCPSARAIAALRAAGARVGASTDAHDARDVGRYDRVAILFEGVRS